MLDESVLSDVTVVMPCYNEGMNIENTIKHLKKIGFKNILIVDDDSSDDTYSKAINQEVFVLRNRNNLGFNSSLLKGLYEINTKFAFIPRPYHIFEQDSLQEFIHFGKKGNYALLFPEAKDKDAFSTSISSFLYDRYGININEPFLDIVFINDDLLEKIKTETISNDFMPFELVRLVIKNNLKLGTLPIMNYYPKFNISHLLKKLRRKNEYFNRAFPKEFKESFKNKVKTDVLIAVLGYLIIRLLEIIISKYII